MFIIVGLGNPGREYMFTRHNIGFMVVDILAHRWGIEVNRSNHRALFGEGRKGTERVVLAKPQTFMNNSGWSVRDLVNWYKCENDELILIYDDIDLPAGDIRIRAKGSSGTHNGMRSVIYQLGFDDFPRIRVGIGRAEHEGQLIGHVLSAPDGDEAKVLDEACQKAADAVELIVSGQMQEAQARFNKKKSGSKQKKEPEENKSEESTPAENQ